MKRKAVIIRESEDGKKCIAVDRAASYEYTEIE